MMVLNIVPGGSFWFINTEADHARQVIHSDARMAKEVASWTKGAEVIPLVALSGSLAPKEVGDRVAPLLALADRIEAAGQAPITVSKDAAQALREVLSRLAMLEAIHADAASLEAAIHE